MKSPVKQESGQPHQQKICIAITKGIWGGAQEYVYTMASSLSGRDGTRLAVLTGAGEALPEKLRGIGVSCVVIETLGRDISLLKDWKSFWQICRYLRSERPDILHLNSSKMGLLGALAGRLCGLPRIIFTAHGWAFNENRSIASKIGLFFLHYISVLLSHQTIAVSEKTRSDIAFFGIRGKINVIHNGIDKINFLPKEEAREKLDILSGQTSTKRSLVGTIAELHKNKGVDLLIRAAEKLPEEVLTYIIGAGEDRESLEKLIHQRNLTKKCFLLGRVDNAKRLLSAFDIFVQPSRNENLPFALLEAGQASLPCVASRVGGMPEVIENGQSGILVTPENPSELARAIEYFLTNQKEGEKCGENLKKKVEDEFSLEKMVEKTLNIYYKQ